MLKSSCLGYTVSTRIVTNIKKVACHLGAIKLKIKMNHSMIFTIYIFANYLVCILFYF